MPHYVSIKQARNMPGLRVVLPPAPGPWAESIKGILHVKRIPYTPVLHEVGTPGEELREWTAQTSSPVLAWNDERPRTVWNDQLYLAERIAPVAQLIPDATEDRALMFGMANELMGETGMVWSLRVLAIHRGQTNLKLNERARAMVDFLAAKYQHGVPDEAARASARCAEIVRQFAERLERQHQAGSRFLIGDRLSALDIYWSAAAAMLQPLPQEICDMPRWLRVTYTANDPNVAAALRPTLLEHRDFIYRDYLKLPLDFQPT
jgi:glutathione S-transferase